MLIVQSHRVSLAKIQEKYPDAVIIDITSRGVEPWISFSPFYPHGNIPVPFSDGWFSYSVEGIWQGLKVFESADVDPDKFKNRTMNNLKRSVRRYGKVLGHRQGVAGTQLLGYVDARYAIYLPTYSWVLENCLQDPIARLQQLESERTVVLLDYETNCDVTSVSRPLSHAGLVKLYIEGNWPQRAM